MRKAVVLLSGGVDSTTVLAIARDEGFACHALTVEYGQRHAVELIAARAVASSIGVEEHRFLSVGLDSIGGSALTAEIEVPKGRLIDDSIPMTYVPARNTIFLSLALGYAEVVGAFDLFIGANAVDYSGYPDCRPAFLEAFEQLAAVATKAGVEGASFRVHAPLLTLSKREIIERGLSLGVDYGLTWSCYSPTAERKPCGECDSCQIRDKAFGEIRKSGFGIPNPV